MRYRLEISLLSSDLSALLETPSLTTKARIRRYLVATSLSLNQS